MTKICFANFRHLIHKPPASAGVYVLRRSQVYTKTTKPLGFVVLVLNHYAMKRNITTLSHSYYECKYHCVWTPKYRGKVLKDNRVKKELERIFKTICKWKGWNILELSIQDDHIHMVISFSPRNSISYVMQTIKGKSSAWIKKRIKKKIERLSHHGSVWARGYFVSTIGADEYLVRRYVKHQDVKHQTNQESLFKNYFN